MKKSMLVVLLCLAAALLTACAASGQGGEETPSTPAFDMDLTVLSDTVLYAQVYNMLSEYDVWLGKVIRLPGTYTAMEDLDRGVVYHACVISDATACCALGIEFVRAGEYAWPDDYPEMGANIVVTGRLEQYDEDGTTYLHLVDATLEYEAGK